MYPDSGFAAAITELKDTRSNEEVSSSNTTHPDTTSLFRNLVSLANKTDIIKAMIMVVLFSYETQISKTHTVLIVWQS